MLSNLCLLSLIGSALGGAGFNSERPDAATLEMEIWYGDHQRFGEAGIGQRWINVLGNLHSTEGLDGFVYTLNGSSHTPVRIGPDGRRLLEPGDFNVEIDRRHLRRGFNELILTATDLTGRSLTKRITVELRPRPHQHSPLLDWRETVDIQEFAQVVDGRWFIEEGGIRPVPTQVGYDRVVSIGDVSWGDYEVKVPITLNAIDTSAFDSQISLGPGFGFGLHWLGHTDSPVSCPPPHCGWDPMGSANWYEFDKTSGGRLKLSTNHGSKSEPELPLEMRIGETYWFRARAQRVACGSLYSLRVWERGKPEPQQWTLRQLAPDYNLSKGSIALIAHHVDATFGNLEVIMLDDPSLWGLLKGASHFLSETPMFLVWVGGLCWFFRSRKERPFVSRLMTVAIGILILRSLAGILLHENLGLMLQNWGLGTSALRRSLLAKDFVLSIAGASAWVLILVAFFRRAPQTN